MGFGKNNVRVGWNGKERRDEKEKAEEVPSVPCPGADPKVIFQSHSPAHCCLSYSCEDKMKFITILIRNISRNLGQNNQRWEGTDHKGKDENVTETICCMEIKPRTLSSET